MNKDTLQVVLSDLHTGNNNALFPNRTWSGKNGLNHAPTSGQQAIYKEFERIMQFVKKARKNKKVILVHNGDAIEGVHHNNVDVCTRDVREQQDIHIELMDTFQKGIGWQRGDKLYYVTGTETHTGDCENEIGRELNAQQGDDNFYTHNHLKLNVNGNLIWFVHHGPTAGKGVNEGNSLRNWLRDIYWDSKKDRVDSPVMIFFGHVHVSTYATYIANDCGRYITIHGIICPSFQAKTRYANMRMPVARNKVGAVTCEISADGDIRTPIFHLMETKSIDRMDA